MSTLALNKRARFDYDILDTYEAGLKLTGAEVKSAKAGHVQLKTAYISLRNGEIWLIGAHISAYKPAGKPDNYNPERNRKLLIKRREIKYLIGKTAEAGLTLVPISLYTKGDLVKCSFGLARGKKNYEKREAIKKRDVDRSIRRAKRGDLNSD